MAAEDAVAAQQSAVGRLAERRDRLVAELAEAQDVSVELAEQRQTALERRAELRRQRAAARAFERRQERAEEEAAQQQAEPEPAPEPEPEPQPAPEPVSQDPRDIAWSMMASYGWASQTEFDCLDALYISESNWDPLAVNPSSGAYGIPQSLPAEKMAAAGDDWRTNPVTQLEWGLAYIQERYGTPCSAWSFKQANNWY
ncbi:MAG: transglycosylase SLT domain-containing protein [Propionibacteriales bacterium]|nr:transglycosylase SLT domain-containing protein [Propionibacteriales bacterium]